MGKDQRTADLCSGDGAVRPINRRVPHPLCWFFDPGFGYGLSGIRGTKAVLEVRAHEIPIFLEDRQLVGKPKYHKMAKEPDKIYGPSIGSSYQQQGLALSKQFKREEYAEQESNSSPRPTLAPPQLITG